MTYLKGTMGYLAACEFGTDEEPTPVTFDTWANILQVTLYLFNTTLATTALFCPVICRRFQWRNQENDDSASSTPERQASPAPSAPSLPTAMIPMKKKKKKTKKPKREVSFEETPRRLRKKDKEDSPWQSTDF